MMAGTKKAPGKPEKAAPGDGGGGQAAVVSFSQKKKKKQPNKKKPAKTNKQSIKQRVRAEAAEKSRLLRKAKLAMQKKMQRERTAAAAATAQEEGAGGAITLSAPPSFEHGSGSVVPAPPRASPASPGNASGARRTERREAVHHDVEVKLGQWRRKRAREEAGLPGDGERQYGSCPAGAGYYERSDGGGGMQGGAFGRSSLSAGGGGRGEAGDSRVPGGARGCWRGAANGGGRWPEVFNAPAPRRSMPRPGRAGPFSSAATATARPGGSGSTGVTSDARARDAGTRWVAPWMVGLVDRFPGGAAGPRGRGGRDAGRVGLVGSEEGEAGLLRGASDGGALHSRGPDGSDMDICGAGSSHGSSVKGPEGAAGDGGAEGGGEGGGLSDLHHEILRFEDYVSLTPAEVAARENLVSSVQASAREALGSGATARAYGSYGGAGDELCFSIFLSDVDISVRPPADPSIAPPPQGRSKPPARSTLGGFLDLTRGSDDGFEEGSSSSDSSSSSSDSDSDSESVDDRAGANSKLSPGPQAAAASDAASAIYVASSGSESDRPEEPSSPSRPQQGGGRPAGQPGRSTEKHARGGTSTGPSSGCHPADTAVPPPDQLAALSVTSAGKAGDDRGGSSVVGGSAPGAEALGFYIDNRPDPALQKLALRERERAAEGGALCPSDGVGREECGNFGRQPVAPPSAATVAGAAEADTAVELLSARGFAKNLPSTNPSSAEAKPAEAASARAGEEVASSSKSSAAAGAEVSASLERGIAGGAAAEVASSSKPSAAAGAEVALTSKPAGAAAAGSFLVAIADLRAEAAAVGERNTMDIPDIGETTAQASSTDPGDPAAPIPAVVPGAVPRTDDETTTPGPSNTTSSSVSPTRKEKKRLRSPFPRPPEGRLASEDDVGSGGGKRGLLEAGESEGSRVTEEGESGRNRAVLSPDGGGRSGKGKKKVEGEHGREGEGKEEEEGEEEEEEDEGEHEEKIEEGEQDEEVGKKELEEEEKENESGSRAGKISPTPHVGDGERPVAKVASSASADSAVVDAATSAIVSDSEVASAAVQLLADRIRAESERTVRLRAIAASLAAELWHTGASGTSSGGAIGPGNPVQAAAAVGQGNQGNQEDEDGDGDGYSKDPEEARYSEGLKALVREQEKRNRGGSLPAAFVSNPGGGGGPAASQNSRESSRAARLQAALTASAEAAAKRRRSGIAVPPGGVLEIHARPGLAGRRGGWDSGREPWRGGRAGGKARAVSGLRKLGKQLLKKRWVEKFEFRSRAKVPIIAMLDARGGVDCDVSWAGDGGGGDCWEDPAEAPGPTYFAKMFPGTFRPLALILKVFMRQRGLDKPFTGGVGSFKLYALIASHLQACGCERAQQQPRDLGHLLLGFFRRYSYTSKERLAPTTVLRVKDLTVDLGSAYRAMAASKDFAKAAQALSLAIAEEASSSKNRGLSAEGKGTAACSNRNPKRPKMNHSESKIANLTPPAQATVPVGGGTTEGNAAARDAQQSTSVTTGSGRSKRLTPVAATGVGLHDDGSFVLGCGDDDDGRHVGLSGSLFSSNRPLEDGSGFALAVGVGDGRGETSGCGGAHGNADLDYDQPRDGEVDASGSRQHGQPSFRDGASKDGSIRSSDHLRDGTKDRSESQLRNGSSEARSESQHQQVEHAAQPIRRRSILGRVIWGSDLRRERESRLVAVGSGKASPRPASPEPGWHVKLEASSHPGGEGQPDKQPLETCPGAKPCWGHGSNSGGLFEASSDAKGSGGGGSSGGRLVQQQKQQPKKKKPKAKKVDKVQKKKTTVKKAVKKNAKKTVKKTTKKMKEGKKGNSSNALSHNSSNGSTKEKRKRASSDQDTISGSTKQQPKKAKSEGKKRRCDKG
ncbi:conserved unknown protein [Ectocarpus siliculosus]|uniref:PAP-associated domain-containing protein n=1 Tax=Ectocarpus siliculosus TaxID=2880 RepID=D8LHQ6_ECTSI|nr:conserved unknown protein [Ectocarpus siliculosus]|eukprot:CBN79338.1 conserved unknown protein [Ectocarpus siliculosus]